MKRKRCPFCRQLALDIKAHIIWIITSSATVSVCDRMMQSHKKSDTSPQFSIPCPGGRFEP